MEEISFSLRAVAPLAADRQDCELARPASSALIDIIKAIGLNGSLKRGFNHEAQRNAAYLGKEDISDLTI